MRREFLIAPTVAEARCDCSLPKIAPRVRMTRNSPLTTQVRCDAFPMIQNGGVRKVLGQQEVVRSRSAEMTNKSMRAL